jgi:hypothetical protein
MRQLRQLAADRQSQSHAAVFSGGGRVRLGEMLEDPRPLRGRDPDAAVPHAVPERARSRRQRARREAGHDFASRGEFDGVVYQGNQNLAQPQQAAQHAGRLHVEYGDGPARRKSRLLGFPELAGALGNRGFEALIDGASRR